MKNTDIKKTVPTLCMVSSSGGHWEQLIKLKAITDKYHGFYVTEKTAFQVDADYLMIPTDIKDWLFPLKMTVNSIRALRIWLREKPDFVITTGAMISVPFFLLARLTGKKFVFIETFGRTEMPTITGRFVAKHTDLFIVQWESMLKYYKNAVYVGCLYE